MYHMRQAVGTSIPAVVLCLPLAGHLQALAVHLHHQLLGAEAVGIHLHLETILCVDIVPYSCHIISEQPHRQCGHLVLFCQDCAGTPGRNLAPVGETTTDPLHPSEQLLSKGARLLVQRSALAQGREREEVPPAPRPVPLGLSSSAVFSEVPFALAEPEFAVSYARPTSMGQVVICPDTPVAAFILGPAPLLGPSPTPPESPLDMLKARGYRRRVKMTLGHWGSSPSKNRAWGQEGLSPGQRRWSLNTG